MLLPPRSFEHEMKSGVQFNLPLQMIRGWVLGGITK
jgi:hypothetical protein